jgi:phage-related minor tail protein
MPDPNDSLSAAANALAGFAGGPVTSAANAIDQAVTRSFNSVAATIARATTSGRDSMAQLTSAILADFDRIAAAQFIAKPLEGLVGSLTSLLLPVAGARAAGGPVAAGMRYLVGENGPELFTPAGSGEITPGAALAPASRAPVVVNIQTQDAPSFLKSRSQVAALLARAIAQGQKNL